MGTINFLKGKHFHEYRFIRYLFSGLILYGLYLQAALSPQGSWGKDRIEEGRRHCDRLRDLAALAEKLGCSPTQLSIAWSLKHEPVQCLLLGATSAEQLHQSLQSLQVNILKNTIIT